MHKFLRSVTTGAVATSLIAGSLLTASGAEAAALTEWNNPYVGNALANGVAYSIKFIGTGKHVYKDIYPDGCKHHFAKEYMVTVYKDSEPSKIIYRKVINGLHYISATNPYDYGTVKYKSAGAMLNEVKRSVNVSDAEAAWQAGGRKLAQYRTAALGSDILEVEDALNTYAVKQAKKIAAAQPIDPETGKHDAGEYLDGIVLDGYDVAANMKSTAKLYGSGCRGEAGQAKFERKVIVTGTMDEHTLIETDVTDNVTIGLERSVGKGKFFRLVDGQRQYFKDSVAAAYTPK